MSAAFAYFQKYPKMMKTLIDFPFWIHAFFGAQLEYNAGDKIRKPDEFLKQKINRSNAISVTREANENELVSICHQRPQRLSLIIW